MVRRKTGRRRTPRANPRGVLDVRRGGYGFVKTAEGEFFIPQSKMGGAFDGDVVEVAPLPVKGGSSAGEPAARRADEKPKARVVAVVSRTHDTLIGRYEVAEPFGVVVPEDPRIPYDIFTMRSDTPDIPDGSLVRVRITTFPSKHEAATGVVEEVIGQADDEDTAIELIIARHKLETRFSDASCEQARQATLDEHGALVEGYRDLRDRFVFTIDPADARDFDDAVSLAREGSLWRVGVHIADVAHYVPWDSSIDLDARRRATSTYLVDRVIPMLPHELSSDLCSLKPGEVRRTMTADLYLDDQANVVRCDLYPALIRSKQRLTYEEAQEMLGGTAGEADTAEGSAPCCSAADVEGSLAWCLAHLSRIAKKRAASRTQRGGIDFSTTEAKVRLDAEGHPVAIDVRRKTDATELIEEAMIMANEAVARYLSERSFPSLYRVHEQPSTDSMLGLLPVLEEFSWFGTIDKERLVAGEPHAVQQVLVESAGRPEGELVSTLVLRSMKRAVYKPLCEGHYGLASTAYTHFTSPIRRYPDLVVHRMLKAQLGVRPVNFERQTESLGWIAEHSSEMERIADAAARESQEYKIIEYLQGSIGQTFSAVISGVATYGVYVRLENTAEGLVPIRDLGREYFALDPERHMLTGQESGRTWRLGQRMVVTLKAAEPRTRTLDFRRADAEAD